MKLNFGKRLVLFLHWLLSLIFCVLALCHYLWPAYIDQGVQMLNAATSATVAEIIGIAFIAVYVLMSIFTLTIILSRDKKRADRGFITVDATDAGRTRIAIGAVEQMIRIAVSGIDAIVDMKTSVTNNEDSISINTNVSIMNGAHVPTVTMNIQRAIRNYIELNCGIAVREVSVSVNALETPGESGKSGRRKGCAAPVAQPVPVIEPVAEAEVAPSEEPEETVQEDVQPEEQNEESV